MSRIAKFVHRNELNLQSDKSHLLCLSLWQTSDCVQEGRNGLNWLKNATIGSGTQTPKMYFCMKLTHPT